MSQLSNSYNFIRKLKQYMQIFIVRHFFQFNTLKIFNTAFFFCHPLACITLYDHTFIHTNAFKHSSAIRQENAMCKCAIQ